VENGTPSLSPRIPAVKTLNFVLVRSSVILTLLVAAVAIASSEQTTTKLADLGPTTGQEIHH
jgi:hypothetical protein